MSNSSQNRKATKEVKKEAKKKVKNVVIEEDIEPELDISTHSKLDGFLTGKLADYLVLFCTEVCDQYRDECTEDVFPINDYYTAGKKRAHNRGKGKLMKTAFNVSSETRLVIRYFCTRYLWEVLQMDVEKLAKYEMSDIEAWVLDGVSTMSVNVSSLVIYTGKAMHADKYLTDSYGMEIDLQGRIAKYLKNPSVIFYVAHTLTRFFKWLMTIVASEFWFNNARTISRKNLKTAIATCRIFMPQKSTVMSSGFMDELVQYISENSATKSDSVKSKTLKAISQSDGEESDGEESDGEESKSENQKTEKTHKGRRTRRKLKKKETKSSDASDEESSGQIPEYDDVE
jgi:hypothetical protein